MIKNILFSSAYKEKIGFTGQLLLEPKPKEPTSHQYDYGQYCPYIVTVAFCIFHLQSVFMHFSPLRKLHRCSY